MNQRLQDILDGKTDLPEWKVDAYRKAIKQKPKNWLPVGDWIARTLASVGITPRFVASITGRKCGCEKRKKFLNRIGSQISRLLWK